VRARLPPARRARKDLAGVAAWRWGKIAHP
jgi:hypothetical protein